MSSLPQNAFRHTLFTGIFLVTMDMAFEGINGCKSIINDILVWGSSKEDHDNSLIKVLKRTRVAGIKWNAE